MSSTEESTQLKAGHPPAVKAGGMRITQHKPPHDKSNKETSNEDFTGLSGPSPLPDGPVSVGGAVSKGNADFSAEAAQVAHCPKPAVAHAYKPQTHIQQPRK